MVQSAIVKKQIKEGVVEVSLLRQVECGLSCSGNCAGCMQKPQGELLALASDPIGTKPGERVEVEPSAGHSIGLEDHEAGDVSSVNTDIIRPGQCFSVEPGIYLPDEEIGVRIEDLVLITEDGCEVLNHFTKDLIVVPQE